MLRASLYAVRRYSHAVALRAELLLELLRAHRRRHIAAALRLALGVLRYPARYEPAVRLMRFISAGEQVHLYDVGAHEGIWSATFTACFPSSRLSLFEPVASTFHLLEERFANHPEVQLFQFALSDRSGEAQIRVFEESSAMSSIHNYSGPEASATIHHVEAIQTRRLDELLDVSHLSMGINVLKIDVQGHELSVLTGGQNVLEYFDFIIIECSFAHQYRDMSPSFASVSCYLADHDLYPIIFMDYGRGHGPYRIDGDVLFARAKAVDRIYGW